MIATYPLDEHFPILPNDTLWEPNFAETDVLVRLLRVLRIERAPPAAHFEQDHTQAPKVHELRVPVLV